MPIRRILRLFVLSMIVMAVSVVISAQTGLTAEVQRSLNVRQGPSTQEAVVSVFDPGTVVNVEGRNEFGDWLYVTSQDGAVRGWVAIGFVRFPEAIRIMEDIPFTDARGNAVPGASSAGDGDSEASVSQASPQAGEVVGGTVLRAGSSVMRNVRSIYQQGQEWGLNPAMFVLVGDSNVADGALMCNFGRGNYDLGGYGYLQGIIDHFNQTGSFCYDSVTTSPGFGTFAVLDPTFAPVDRCGANETPIVCEVRISRPAYALIYLSIQDIEDIRYVPTLNHETYRLNLLTVVRSFAERGVVPILFTIPTADNFHPSANPTYFNNVIRDVAAAERVPLIDVRAAIFEFDNRGMDDDAFHLMTPPGGQTSFTGNETMYGRTQAELLALEMLNDLHRSLAR